MKAGLIGLGGLIALVLGVVGLEVIASEQGEVVVLTTFDSSGEPHSTRVWVVDLEGHAWLRSGAPTSAWFARIKDNPLVRVERDGNQFTATANTMIDRRGDINAAMRDKYGWADQYIGFLFGRDDAVPLRLDRAGG